MKKSTIAIFLLILVIGCLMSCSKSTSDQTAVTPSEQQETAEFADSSVFIDLIMKSYSARNFTEGVVSDEALEIILQSANKAPSAMNAQPWHFTVVKNSDMARQLVPRDYKEGAVVIVVSGKPFDRPGLKIAFDAGLASQNIYLAAQALGLGARLYFGGVQNVNENLKDVLGIPNGYEAEIIILTAYLDPSTDALTSASPRRPIEENVNYVD